MFALAQGRQSQSPLKSMLAWCRAWFKRSSESDFGCCAEAEIERMAKDVRMSVSELRAGQEGAEGGGSSAAPDGRA